MIRVIVWTVLLTVFVKFWIGVASADLRVIDGDTVHIDGERVRIYGLDCPEMPGGLVAKQTLMWLLTGATITLKRRGKDRYQRTVAKVFADGRDVTTQMIASGVCREYCKYSKGEYGTCLR